MKNHKSHEFITSVLFPSINSQVVNKVDAAIDNPTFADNWFAEMNKQLFGNSFQIPGMFRGGHRTVNHDMLSAMLKGFEVGGSEGMYAAMSHLLADTAKDNLNRQFGMYGGDMIENAMLFLRQQNKTRRHKIRSF